MTINSDSRYVNGDVITVPLTDGTHNLAVFATPVNTSGMQVFFRLTVAGDRFDRLANEVLGDPTKWWVLADLNPEVLFPFDLRPGTMIRIPVVEK